jgi:ligand-binding sensor domain-containing protein
LIRFSTPLPWFADCMYLGAVRKWLKLGVALVTLTAAAALAVIWRAARALRDSTADVASARQVSFTESRLDLRAPGNVETVATPASFRSATMFQGRLHIAASSGLYVYDAAGALQERYRVGLELPPAPLVTLAAAGSDLHIATAGEGWLIYDGRGFRQVLPQDARSLTAVLPLATGRVLLGTERRGVLVYDGQTITPFHAALSSLHVTALAGDEGDLWIGTLAGGLWHWRAGQSERFGETEGLPDRQVLSLAGHGDTVYAGTPLGVAEFRSGRFHRRLAEGAFARALLPRGAGLLVGTLEEGVLGQQGRAEPQSVEQLLEIQGQVYALSAGGLYKNGAPVLQRDDAQLADGNISALAVDRAGRLWIGYFDRGLDILDGERVTHVEDERVFCVNRIVHDERRGLTAVATANGLVMFDAAGRPRQALTRREGLIADHVTDVALRPGGLTIATPAGLTLLDGRGARSLYAFHGLVNNHVYALGGAGERLLAGTLGGLSVLDGDHIRAAYTTANSALRNNWITAIAPAGEEWMIGTYGGGILRLDASQRMIQETPPLEVNPAAMASTATHVYAGTLRHGLYVYDRAAARWSPLTAGLPSRNVTAIATHGNRVYIGTDNGLVVMP